MLAPEDLATARQAETFLVWQSQPAGRSDAAFVADYRRLRSDLRSPTLIDMLDHRLAIRTLVAALRRRALGRPAPVPGTVWGIGPWLRQIEQHWLQPDFGLTPALPWLPEAHARLDAKDDAGLERLLMGLVWTQLQHIEDAEPFGFPAVLAYLFKWDMVKRRLDSDRDAAAVRLEALTREALGEHDTLFA